MFTQQYIEEVFLRAQRAMLIISERIQDNCLYLYASIYAELRYTQRDIYILHKSLSDNFDYRATLSDYDALINVLVSKCQEVDSFNTEYNTLNPNYQNIGGGGGIIVTATGNILQTAVVFPGDTMTTYTFPELIGATVLTVYRGTGTTLRAWSIAPTNEYVQFNDATGQLTFLYPFSLNESLWAEYKTS